MKIIWSPLAIAQVRENAEYIALDKPAAAEKWVDNVFESVNVLANFPESGRVVPEIDRKEIREIVKGNFRIIYKIKDDHIFVLVVKRYRQLLNPIEIEP